MAQSKPGSYKLREDVNQGPHGAPKGKVAGGGGQNSDGGGEHDQLIDQPIMHRDPYRAKGSDWPVKDVDARDGQSGPYGTAEGKDSLVNESENQCGPRFVEDDGPGSSGAGTPTKWNMGGRSGKLASNFPIETNKGESNQEGGEMGEIVSVNLQSGLIEAQGKPQTRVKEIQERHVHIPSA